MPRHVVLTNEGQRLLETATAGKLGSDLIFTRHDGAAWGRLTNDARRDWAAGHHFGHQNAPQPEHP